MSFKENRPIIQSILYDNDGRPTTVASGTFGSRLRVETSFDRTGNLDAFNRLRVGHPVAIFDSKQVFDDASLFFTTTTSGGGTITYDQQTSSSLLETTTAAGDKALRQTKRYFNYQSGKGLLTLLTFNFDGAEENVRKRVGYFDDYNGLFLELDGSDFYIVERTDVTGSVVDTKIPQSSWNLDTFDGNGPSGIDIQLDKSQLVAFDFQWLGVGAVRIAFFGPAGNYSYVHQHMHANSLDTIYMRTPNLPVRWEIENTGTPAQGSSLRSLCCSVMSEGGSEPVGITRSASRGTSVISTNNTLKPIISIRLKQAYNRATVVPDATSIIATNSANFYWQVVLNPTITGGNSASWIPVSNSAVEYDISRDGVVSGGTVITSGYAPNNLDSQRAVIQSIVTLASDYVGTQDELVVAVSSLSINEEPFLGSIDWLEVL